MRTWIAAAAAALALAGAATALQQDRPRKGEGYDDTPVIPGQKWKVHDKERLTPPVVTPGAEPGKPPSDAIVLFDGTDLSKWTSGGGDAKWKVENGYFEVVAKTGSLTTREPFGDCQLHIEWSAPNPPKGKSQGRGNSGVYLMGRYEVQVLDSFENLTYADGQAASMYGQWPPMVNACRPPGEWQVYDILFLAPRYKDGAVEQPATLTVMHNGVFVHNRQPYQGPSSHKALAKYPASHPEKGPISLQDHGDPVRFRNVWVRPIKGYDAE